MTFVRGVWTLLRDTPDLARLDFKQRFIGTFSADSRTINARWEIDAGSESKLDFEMTYSMIA
jgi:hypothetical protein